MRVDRPSKSDAVKLHRLSDFMLADASSEAQIPIGNRIPGDQWFPNSGHLDSESVNPRRNEIQRNSRKVDFVLVL